MTGVFGGLARRGKLRAEDIEAALDEIRLALLEADVDFRVADDLIQKVRERALGQEVSSALNPTEQVVTIVYEELTAVLGEPRDLILRGQPPRTILMVGLQGSGKTTTTAKLARSLRGDGKKTWMVAADTRRPAARDQLQILGDEVSIPVFQDDELDALGVIREGYQQARKGGAEVILVDTAGRSQLDDVLMGELTELEKALNPDEVLLVADAMTGQEAVNIAIGFSRHLSVTGLILTKMDGDARGGAAISMRTVTGVPIKYIGVGEGMEDLEVFRPDRLASRILGMGDVQSLVEKAEATLDQEKLESQAERLASGKFTLNDFADQLAQVQRMGPFGKIMDLMPGGLGAMTKQLDMSSAEKQIKQTEAILSSMTPQERENPRILNASRKRRIAAGSGTSVQQVNQILRQHKQMQRMMKQIGQGNINEDLASLLK